MNEIPTNIISYTTKVTNALLFDQIPWLLWNSAFIKGFYVEFRVSHKSNDEKK